LDLLLLVIGIVLIIVAFVRKRPSGGPNVALLLVGIVIAVAGLAIGAPAFIEGFREGYEGAQQQR
jgi:hypothetical protein